MGEIKEWWNEFKYLVWKRWLLASSSHVAVVFMLEMRILTVYDPAFKEGGLEKVKKLHSEHMERVLSKLNKESN